MVLFRKRTDVRERWPRFYVSMNLCVRQKIVMEMVNALWVIAIAMVTGLDQPVMSYNVEC